MFEPISFLTSRTGIALMGALALSVALAWGYYHKAERYKAENRLVQSERDYQARMAEALEKQRIALDVAIAEERQRRIALEAKWKGISKSLKGTADYDKSAPASIIHTLNSLSDAAPER
jgi:hypothetical protein